jgi:hypothetical protein
MTITVNDRNAFFWQTDRESFDWEDLLMKLAGLTLETQLTKRIS